MRALLILTSLLVSSTVFANDFGDPVKGKLKTPSCVYCHGITGVSTTPAYPHLAGQHAEYLFDSMMAYKNGQRTGGMAEMMAAQLRMLNEEDIRDVAAFYAEQTLEKQ